VATVADRLGRDQVFGPPVASGGTTLIPVTRVRAGGGVGGLRPGTASTGAGVVARPLGAFAVGPDGKVAWHPAVDVNRIVLGGQLALVAVLVVASRPAPPTPPVAAAQPSSLRKSQLVIFSGTRRSQAWRPSRTMVPSV
jgi:hypothetical protein